MENSIPHLRGGAPGATRICLNEGGGHEQTAHLEGKLMTLTGEDSTEKKNSRTT